MVKIRMKRVGTAKRPKYRLVVQDARVRRDGAVKAELGYYDPQANPPILKIDVEAATTWLANGAQPSETAATLLRRAEVVMPAWYLAEEKRTRAARMAQEAKVAAKKKHAEAIVAKAEAAKAAEAAAAEAAKAAEAAAAEAAKAAEAAAAPEGAEAT